MNLKAHARKTWVVFAAAVAAVVLAIAFVGQSYRSPVPADSSTPVSSGPLTLISPLGRVTLPFEFQWTSSIAEPAYRIEVFDAAGAPVAARVTRTGRIAASDLRQDWKPGSYTWKISLFDSKGIFVVASPVQPFEIAVP